MTEPMKTAIEYLAHELSIKTETIELNLHYTLTLDECQRVMESFAAKQVAAERERIKKEIYKVFGDSVVEEWSSSRIRKEILEKLIDRL